jgi:predicted nucleic acid-binding protein
VVAVNITDFLSKSRNVDRIEVYYKWNLIEVDKDDNKFVDCAIAGNAQFIVTNDKHFRALQDIDFPKVEIISSVDFMKKLKEDS